MSKPLVRIAIVAGEDSGDMLGAGLISSLKKRHPHCVFEGVGGSRMIAEGFTSFYPLDRLAVMGLVEPLKRLPELLAMRRSLRERWLRDPPDLFIGIDAPDFNLSLEGALKQGGIKTCHYVSPSVWAWRQGRIKKIKRCVDLMLTLFPFEAAFYDAHDMNVHFVGHPLADKIPMETQTREARVGLGLPPDAAYVALLPGSRRSEVEHLGSVFFAAAQQLLKAQPDLTFLVPAANPARFAEIQQLLADYPGLPVKLFDGDSHAVMAAADVVLMASGTTTLEAMLLKKPMVIAYRMAPLSYWILKQVVKSKYVGLPNLLANRILVPEFLQDAATVANLSAALNHFFTNQPARESLQADYREIHLSLRKDANEEAAKAIEALWLN